MNKSTLDNLESIKKELGIIIHEYIVCDDELDIKNLMSRLCSIRNVISFELLTYKFNKNLK